MNKQNYIITNVLAINNCANVIRSDLFQYWINQKYTLNFEKKENVSIDFVITAFNCNNGFDIGFDMIRMV